MAWPKTNKYRNKKVELAGYSFASKAESDLFLHLKSMEQAGEITELKCQQTVYLSRARIIYKPDFSYFRDGVKEYAEYKGFETSDWRIKRKLWMFYGPGVLYIYKGSCKLYETIVPDLEGE